MASLTEKEYKIKLQQRTSTRANVTKEIKKIEPVFLGTSPDLEKAEVILNQLSLLQEKLKGLDEVLLPFVTDENLGQEIDKSDQYQNDLSTGISVLQIRLRNLSQLPNTDHDLNSGNNKDVTPRLPKLEIKKYSGDPLSWDEFWDDYKSSVHDRKDLPTIDKFKYLRSFLEGEALRLADGYRLTVANYDTVLTALKERFGDPQIATHSHFEALIALAPVSHDLSELRIIMDKCESHIRSLVALGLPETTFGVVFTPLILSKLPKFVKMEIHRKNGSQPWDLANLRKFLKEEIAAREKSERSFASVDDKPRPNPSRQGNNLRNSPIVTTRSRPATASALSSPASEPGRNLPNCAFCSNKHYSGDCRKYPDFHSRIKQIPGHCRSCLRKNHKTSDCRVKKPCYHCKKEGHHQSLCAAKFGSATKTKTETLVANTIDDLSAEPSTSDKAPETSLSLQTPNSKSVLQTALASIQGTKGTSTARIYFDTGGTRSFVSTRLATQIGARFIGKETVSVGRFRDSKRSTISYKIFEFEIILPDGTQRQVRMSAEATISCPVQLIPIDTKTNSIFSSVKLAEPLVQEPTMVPIDILIGTDYYYDFIGQEQVRCGNGLVLLSSPFGFVVGGSLKTNNQFQKMESSLLIHQLPSKLQSIEQFWNLEDIGIKGDYGTEDDDAALQFFNKTVQYADNRYHVKWPWKADFPDLPSNYKLSRGRLTSLLKRLHPQAEVLQRYNDIIEQQREKGIVEIAPVEPEGIVHYLPHHHVIRPSKATTKLRIVYDGSAKASKDSLSLNDCLHRGPVFLSDSVGIILRHRLHSVAVTSDIEKAFLQVGLQPADRDVTRFLWLKDTKKPPSESNLQCYRFCRVPFGIVSSPFLLAATIAHHLRSSSHESANKILHNVYVDNIFSGSEDSAGAVKFYQEAKSVFAAASMNLREWFSNSEVVTEAIPEEDRGTGAFTSILGLRWDLTEDKLSVSVKLHNQSIQSPTKRHILRDIASVFDPCGFFSPITIAGKILMQRLWKEKLDWDATVSEDVQQAWMTLAEDIKLIPSHGLPRSLPMSVFNPGTTVELHCFADASNKAYSATVYVRITHQDVTKIALLMSKSRVAPLKCLSIPRLELMAALIGTRLLRFVSEQLQIELQKVFLWTDSTCVLSWVLCKPVKTVFVQNRIREITSCKNIIFRYVPSSDNPADISSRGTSFRELQSRDLWWSGPPWLKLSEEYWPVPFKKNDDTKESSEGCNISSTLVSQSVATTSASDSLVSLDRFSSLPKLYRVTAYMKRFVQAAQRKGVPSNRVVTAREMECSRLIWIQRIQRLYFPDIIAGLPSTASKSLIQRLGIFTDSDGFLKCKGRYLSPETDTYPILLPKHCCFSDLLIMDCHRRLLHTGVRHTLAELRQRYWLVHGRSEVKRVIHSCKLCRHYHGGSFRLPEPPALPRFRICSQRPFETTGLDYLGPLLLGQKNTNSVQKVWICLFTCAAIRAIHLEVVSDLSTEQFLLGLRRFVSIFGRPQLIICDNAAQFHTAQKILNKLWKDIVQSHTIQTYSAQEGITWKFIPELAPWMGGFYERMIGIVKNALKKTIQRRCVNLIELQTIICEVSSVVNSRPLLYSEDTVEGECLTPAHFLLRNNNSFPSSHSEDDTAPNRSLDSNLIQTGEDYNPQSTIFGIPGEQRTCKAYKNIFENPKIETQANMSPKLALLS